MLFRSRRCDVATSTGPFVTHARGVPNALNSLVRSTPTSVRGKAPGEGGSSDREVGSEREGGLDRGGGSHQGSSSEITKEVPLCSAWADGRKIDIH